MALRLIALDPLQEGVHRTLIRLYMYQDRVGAALDQYRRCRDVLKRELGVPPGPPWVLRVFELESTVNNVVLPAPGCVSLNPEFE